MSEDLIRQYFAKASANIGFDFEFVGACPDVEGAFQYIVDGLIICRIKLLDDGSVKQWVGFGREEFESSYASLDDWLEDVEREFEE